MTDTARKIAERLVAAIRPLLNRQQDIDHPAMKRRYEGDIASAIAAAIDIVEPLVKQLEDRCECIGDPLQPCKVCPDCAILAEAAGEKP